MKVSLRTITSALVIGTALLVAGCNDDDPTSPTPPVVTTPPPTPVPEPTATPTPAPEDKEEVSFLGIIRDVQGSNLDVSSHRVVTTSSTSFVHEDGSPWSLGQVQVGNHVRVKGVVESDASITAKRVTALN